MELPKSSQQQTDNNLNKNKNPQNLLSEARKRLKAEHTEATQSVQDPSAEKAPRLTGRQRAKYPKFIATDDILTAVAKDPFAKLTSSQQYLLQPDPPGIEPFYAQLEEINRIHAQFKQLAQRSHAEINPQARR